MLFELEQECLDAYRRKVDQARHCQVQLRQSLADCEAQLADICGALGDGPVRKKKISGTLKKELQAMMPQLEDMKKKKTRGREFAEVKKQINCFLKEFSGATDEMLDTMVIDDSDLSRKRLEDLQNKLLLLQKEKSERLNQVAERLTVLNNHCLVLGMDFKLTVCAIHPTLDDSWGMGTKSISVRTIESLNATKCRLKDVKLQRMQKLQDLAVTMVELWNLMDTPLEQQKFYDVTRTSAASENEITDPDILSLEFLNNSEAEVMTLEEMKFSQMKEVLL